MTHPASRPVSTTPESPARLRTARFVRSVVLVLSGFAIAFSAPLHSQLSFDRWILAGSLALIGAATVFEYRVLREAASSWLIALRAAVAFAAAVAGLLVADAAWLAVVLAVWAAANAAIAVARLVRGSQSRAVAVPSAVFSAALAALLLIFRDDPVAVIGFFGAYAIARGVFLGISAFDGQRSEVAEGQRPPLNGPTTAVRIESN